VVKLCGKTVW